MNILLDQERHRLLTEAARHANTSAGEIIRRLIDEKLKKEHAETVRQRTAVVNRIKALRKKMKPMTGINYRELIEYGRYR